MDVNGRVGDYRRRMRARGFRPVQIWVPDVRGPHFAAEARRQSALVAGAGSTSDDQAFVEEISVDWGEDDS
ncbi:MAG: antitoxin MazE family protein [Actinobacteria bacterium]|nr:antitoxin MazE family protein [Actinomycetota bacterium]